MCDVLPSRRTGQLQSQGNRQKTKQGVPRVTSRLTTRKQLGRTNYPVASSWVSVFMVLLLHPVWARAVTPTTGSEAAEVNSGNLTDSKETVVLQAFSPTRSFYLHSLPRSRGSFYSGNAQGCLISSSWYLTKEVF